MLDLVHLAGFFRLYVLYFWEGREIVAKTHADAVAHYDWEADGEDVAGAFVGGDSTEDDDESIDAAIESSEDHAFEVVSCVDVSLFVMGDEGLVGVVVAGWLVLATVHRVEFCWLD